MTAMDRWRTERSVGERRLLSLKSDTHLHIHMSPTWSDSDDKIRALIDSFEDPYVVAISCKDLNENLAVARLGLNSANVETILGLKHSPRSIPSITNLIVHNFWSVSPTLVEELIQKPWHRVDVFAINLN